MTTCPAVAPASACVRNILPRRFLGARLLTQTRGSRCPFDCLVLFRSIRRDRSVLYMHLMVPTLRLGGSALCSDRVRCKMNSFVCSEYCEGCTKTRASSTGRALGCSVDTRFQCPIVPLFVICVYRSPHCFVHTLAI